LKEPEAGWRSAPLRVAVQHTLALAAGVLLEGGIPVSRSLSRLQATLLGGVLLAGVVLAAFGLFTVGSRHWSGRDSFQVTVGFQDVGGVEVGSRVRIQGVDAGEVEAIDLPDSAGDPVQLRLRLAGRFRKLIGNPASARVQIGSEGMFSGKFVKIIPGAPVRRPPRDPVVLKAQPTPELTQELSEAAAQAKRVLGALDATLQDVRRGQGTLGQLVKNDKLYRELSGAAGAARVSLGKVNAAVDEVRGAVEDVRAGKGTLGALVKNGDMYRETREALEQVREMVSSVKQNSDALKAMPIVRSYVVDPHKILHRPDCSMERQWLPASRLFQPGKAVLTRQGRRELERVAAWLNRHKIKGSEVAVASYAGSDLKVEAAQRLTQKQSEVVCDYLTSNYKVHKTGWWWWSKRPVQPVGCGAMPSPIPSDARRKLPAPRVEVLLFVPQG
jgi:phospholipid/cholesterol/gamma-HCH transport system substrate-binding protein